MDEVKEVQLCEVANEVEATLVVNLLKDEGDPGVERRQPGHARVRRPAIRVGPSGLRALVDGGEGGSRSSATIPISRTCGTSTSPSSDAPSPSSLNTSHPEPGRRRRAAQRLLRRQLLPPVRQRRRGPGPGAGPGAGASRPSGPRRHPGHRRAIRSPTKTISGVFIHRWVKPRSLGPLFGLSFVAGVMKALAPAPRRDRRDPYPPGALGGRGDRPGAAAARRVADARPARQCRLLRRGRRAGSDPQAGPAPADHPGEYGLRGDLGRDRTPVARAGRPGRPDGADGQRRGCRAIPARPERGRSRNCCPARVRSSPDGCIPRRTCRSCSRRGPRSPAGRRPT